MKGFVLLGKPGCYEVDYEDHGDHSGHELKPCPFCGSSDLEVENSLSASYWVKCKTCTAIRYGERVEIYDFSSDKKKLIAAHESAFLSAVDGWNKRTDC